MQMQFGYENHEHGIDREKNNSTKKRIHPTQAKENDNLEYECA